MVLRQPMGIDKETHSLTLCGECLNWMSPFLPEIRESCGLEKRWAERVKESEGMDHLRGIGSSNTTKQVYEPQFRKD